MKKIVGIIAAVAMAASVFAVDFTAGVRMEGDLFTYQDGKMTALSLTNNNEDYHKPFAFSVTSDRAGASLKINEKKSDAPAITKMNIWFKPFDAVKVEFGNVAEAMNTETMGYWRRIKNYDTWGFKATAEVDALTVSLGILPGAKSTPWFANKDTNAAAAYAAAIADGKTVAEAEAAADAAKTTVAQTVVYAAYNAGDAGTISAMASFENTFDNIDIAAGYKNTFGDVAVFADYMFSKGATNTNYIDADVKYSADGLTAEAYTKVTLASKTSVQLVSRVSKGFDGLNTFVEFDAGNILADTFDAKITGSVGGSVSAMGWEVQAVYEIAAKKFSVPFNVAVAF